MITTESNVITANGVLFGVGVTTFVQSIGQVLGVQLIADVLCVAAMITLIVIVRRVDAS